MKKIDLLEGSIVKTLLYLALPIMGTSFLQMAYNLTDMIWIGRLGSDAVASVGTAGFYVWLSMAFIRLIQVGTEVNVSQSLGAKKNELANRYANGAIHMALVISVLYSAVIIIMSRPLIEFFKLGSTTVENDAISYLIIVSVGLLFTFLNPIISCIYNGSGDSKTPFKINSVGLVANLVLDPIFIFVFKMGVLGAAYATVISQLIVTILLLWMIFKEYKPFEGFKPNFELDLESKKKVLKMGMPVAIQSGLFTIFAILIARIIAMYGPSAIAAQKVGVQVESISYMTANGFAVALGSFTGQNYGAGNLKRVKKGILSACSMMAGFGIFTSLLLFVFAKPIFSIFISSGPSLDIGISYLRILAVSQLFMCVEITIAGGFNGLGKTAPPAYMSIFFTGLRVPFAYLLGRPETLGLDGIWWSISLTSVIKGLIALGMISFIIKKLSKLDDRTSELL